MSAAARILVATDVVADADLVKTLLCDEFDDVVSSTDPDRAIQDFEKCGPGLLILAFDTLEKAERYYLGLYRLSTLARALPHRTVILCNKDDLRAVHELCKKEYFDDYVLFWPLVHDAPRLPMAVHHALRQLAADGAGAPTVRDFAAQARRLGAMESMVEQHAARGDERIDAANLQPVGEWAGALRTDLVPQIESVRTLQTLAERIRPVVLLVDDDEYQHELVHHLLRDLDLELTFATSGSEALATVHRRRPDLILMDVDLPDIGGVETTRRLKSIAQFTRVPVLMVTGHSDKNVVAQSVKAGASGFVVKPFNKEILLAKVKRCLAGTDSNVPCVDSDTSIPRLTKLMGPSPTTS
jgi:CheY-like chemotaxis protein